MTSLPTEKLERLMERWRAIQDELNQGVNQATYVKLNKEFASISPVVAEIQALRKAEAELDELDQLIADFGRQGHAGDGLRRARRTRAAHRRA